MSVEILHLTINDFPFGLMTIFAKGNLASNHALMATQQQTHRKYAWTKDVET
jgi:hypothetical protein